MPAYFIADVHVTDHETYDDYKRQVGPQIAKFGGRFLVRGGNPVVLEGSWRPNCGYVAALVYAAIAIAVFWNGAQALDSGVLYRYKRGASSLIHGDMATSTWWFFWWLNAALGTGLLIGALLHYLAVRRSRNR